MHNLRTSPSSFLKPTHFKSKLQKEPESASPLAIVISTETQRKPAEVEFNLEHEKSTSFDLLILLKTPLN